QLLQQVGVRIGGGRETASPNARVVDQRGRAGPPGADQPFRPDQVVLGGEQDGAVLVSGGCRTLWVVATSGGAVIADLADGALVPRPPRLVPEFLRGSPHVVGPAVDRVHRRIEHVGGVCGVTPVGPVAQTFIGRVGL